MGHSSTRNKRRFIWENIALTRADIDTIRDNLIDEFDVDGIAEFEDHLSHPVAPHISVP